MLYELANQESATPLLYDVRNLLQHNLDSINSLPGVNQSAMKLYSGTRDDLNSLLESPMLLPRHNMNDRNILFRSVKDILTRHSSAGSTIEWLFDYASDCKRRGEPVNLTSILDRHFSLTLLCDHYVGVADPRLSRGSIRKVSSVLDLIEDVKEEALFATAIAFPDSFIDIKIPEGDPDDLPVFYIVPSAFRYILMELVKNAVSASQKACIEISVEESTLVVIVIDSGDGISPDVDLYEFGHVRHKYDRLDLQTSYAMPPSDPLSGVGVGLALSKLIANKYGGDVDVRNNAAGNGATATYTIPLTPSITIIEID